MDVDGHEVAHRLVMRQFPHALAAWLGGSAAAGSATATSDLDVTVLLDGPPAPFRESQLEDSWPVELFVQTGDSIEHFCAQERDARRPTTLRLIGQSTVLVDVEGQGRHWQNWCIAKLAEGPTPLTDNELRAARYRITDLLDDFADSADSAECLMIAAELWKACAELQLTGNRRWGGRGKWLHREMSAFDDEVGATDAQSLAEGVRSAAAGVKEPMIAASTAVLNRFGGRLFHGFAATRPDVSVPTNVGSGPEGDGRSRSFGHPEP